jgi:coenzyme F420 hydrogenase subunit beta
MGTKRLFETVVQGGFCVGCGACAVVPKAAIGIRFTADGVYQAIDQAPTTGDERPDAEPVCPFSDANVDENELAGALFPEATAHTEIGRYIAAYAGFVTEGEYRVRGSSGGVVTWLAAKLLEERVVDGVAHVRSRDVSDADTRMFAYAISRDADSVRSGAKSRYYPIEMSGVLGEIARQHGRYAVIGVPCFIKAVRLLQRKHKVFRERIVLTIGLVCGHLKSAAFAQSLSWEMGVHPSNLRRIDFRHKLEHRPANRYGVRVWPRDVAETVTKPATELFGSDWGLGLFKYQACDYCDDVLAETADVSVGDAWLSKYIADGRGTSIVVTRSAYADHLLMDGMASGSLQLDRISAELAAQSQRAGLRHRREGLGYRLSQRDRESTWHPRKRVGPDDLARSQSRATIYSLRETLSRRSHGAFRRALASGDFDQFRLELEPLIAAYRRAYQPDSLVKRLRRSARRAISTISRRVKGIWIRAASCLGAKR